MGLKEMQRALTILYTNSEERSKFFTSPQEEGKRLSLNEKDIDMILKIPKDQIEFFAKSLQNKRFGAVKKLLPLSYEALRDNFYSLFISFAEDPMKMNSKKHLWDALNFVQFLQSKDIPKWKKELASYETNFLKMQQLDQKFAVHFFTYDFGHKEAAKKPIRRKNIVLSLRFFSPQIRIFHIPLWFKVYE